MEQREANRNHADAAAAVKRARNQRGRGPGVVVEDFTPGHALEIADALTWFDGPAHWLENTAKVFSEIGEGITIRLDGKIACCVGVYPKTAWSAEAWALMTMRASPSAITVVRYIRRRMRAYVLDKGFKRLEINVHAGQLRANRLAEVLGFEFEGPLYCYSPDGSTFHRYSYCGG